MGRRPFRARGRKTLCASPAPAFITPGLPSVTWRGLLSHWKRNAQGPRAVAWTRSMKPRRVVSWTAFPRSRVGWPAQAYRSDGCARSSVRRTVVEHVGETARDPVACIEHGDFGEMCVHHAVDHHGAVLPRYGDDAGGHDTS